MASGEAMVATPAARNTYHRWCELVWRGPRSRNRASVRDVPERRLGHEVPRGRARRTGDAALRPPPGCERSSDAEGAAAVETPVFTGDGDRYELGGPCVDDAARERGPLSEQPDAPGSRSASAGWRRQGGTVAHQDAPDHPGERRWLGRWSASRGVQQSQRGRGGVARPAGWRVGCADDLPDRRCPAHRADGWGRRRG